MINKIEEQGKQLQFVWKDYAYELEITELEAMKEVTSELSSFSKIPRNSQKLIKQANAFFVIYNSQDRSSFEYAKNFLNVLLKNIEIVKKGTTFFQTLFNTFPFQKKKDVFDSRENSRE